jgi:hypothetical protein
MSGPTRAAAPLGRREPAYDPGGVPQPSVPAVLPQGRVYVHEGPLPVYHAGRSTAPYRNALNAAANAALSNEARLTALRRASHAFFVREAA